MLAYLNIEYEDKIYEAEGPPTYNRDCWFKEKFQLGLPFPNLPYFIDKFDGEDVHLTETSAIMKYIAAKWDPKLLGANPV